jgi:hypothetical protein
LREPLGSAIVRIGNVLSRFGADVKAAEIRAALEREARLAGDARRAATVTRGVLPQLSEVPRATTRMRRQFSYTFEVAYVDPASGRTVIRHVSLSTDSFLAHEAAEAEVFNEFGGDYGFNRGNVTYIKLTGVVRAGDAGTL